MNLVSEYLRSKREIKGAFIQWSDLKLLPKEVHHKISNYWIIIQRKKKV